jgi:hypothetical protein
MTGQMNDANLVLDESKLQELLGELVPDWNGSIEEPVQESLTGSKQTGAGVTANPSTLH